MSLRSRLSDSEIVSLILQYVGPVDAGEVSCEDLKALVSHRASSLAVPAREEMRVGVKRPRQISSSEIRLPTPPPCLDVAEANISDELKAHLKDLRSTQVTTMFPFSILLRRLIEHKR